ncbi:hypothetical protein [Pseudomonas sp. 9AZ]|uniref:hypothetical protein n=1 Tax=Pseudomonas sp. 9AZ TaxID=2653168 RepID=UPI0013579D0E|nr:hypothetical protein [Pseudomonas sp. 9AZ]
MSDQFFLIPNGDAIYAVPVEEAKKYKLNGEALVAAKTELINENNLFLQDIVRVIADSSDVTGQNNFGDQAQILSDIFSGKASRDAEAQRRANDPSTSSLRWNSRGEAYVRSDGGWVRERAYD